MNPVGGQVYCAFSARGDVGALAPSRWSWGPHRNLSVFVHSAFQDTPDTMASPSPSKPVSSEDIVTQKVRAPFFRITIEKC